MLGTEDCMATEDDDVMALLSQALPQLPDGDIIGGMDVKDILRVPRLSDGESSSDSSSPCSAFTSEPASSSSSGTSSITPHGPLTAASVALCSEAISVHSTRHAIPPPQPMPVEGILLRITDITIPNHKAVLEAKQRYTDYAMLLYEHYKISEEQLIRWLEGRAALLPSSRDEVAPEVDELRHKYARAFQELEKRFVRNIREVAERAAAMKEEGAGAPIDRALDELRPEQVNVLENWIQCNPDVLVPTTEQLHALSVLTGASEELVYMWCAARRLRAKQEGGM